MKKSFTIILLAVLQSACSAQPAVPEDTSSLISYAEIANEISVSHQKLSRSNETEQTAALSFAESP